VDDKMRTGVFVEASASSNSKEGQSYYAVFSDDGNEVRNGFRVFVAWSGGERRRVQQWQVYRMIGLQGISCILTIIIIGIYFPVERSDRMFCCGRDCLILTTKEWYQQAA
jgi:hypothetical protein